MVASRVFAVAGGGFWGQLVEGCSASAPRWFSIEWKEVRWRFRSNCGFVYFSSLTAVFVPIFRSSFAWYDV